MPKSMYDIIKRQNGEAFARRIRDFNPSIFDIENLPQILKYAGRNPLPLIRFLSTLKVKEESNKADTLDPFELLNRAGYDAFYADTLEKQNSIRPFFKSGEELCTFIDSSRFKKYYIVHAVKRGADKLDREAFNDIEDRQDEYGTSVISIQILKQGGFIKITNRYNHTVDGCDNTFNSNPDNIIPGLTRALADYFEVPIEIGNLDVPNGFLYQNGCLYGYLFEKNNCYVGTDFYFKDGIVYPLDKDSQIMIDGLIFDFKEKKILNPASLSSSLIDVIYEETKGEVWQVQKRGRHHVLFVDNKEILATENGFLKTLFLRKTPEVQNFLVHHKEFEELNGYSLLKIGGKSFSYCPKLRYVHIPRCEEIDDTCFESVYARVDSPLLKRKGTYFIAGVGIDTNKKELISRGKIPTQLFEFLNKSMKHFKTFNVIDLYSATIVYGDDLPFLYFKDNKLNSICLPKEVKVLEKAVLMDIPDLREFIGEGIHLIEDANFLRCHALEKIEIPNARYIGYNCLNTCPQIQELFLPLVEKIPTGVSLTNNSELRLVYAPNLYQTPDLNRLPSLERFDCAKGVYLREKPAFVASNRGLFNKFVFLESTQNENG